MQGVSLSPASVDIADTFLNPSAAASSSSSSSSIPLLQRLKAQFPAETHQFNYVDPENDPRRINIKTERKDDCVTDLTDDGEMTDDYTSPSTRTRTLIPGGAAITVAAAAASSSSSSSSSSNSSRVPPPRSQTSTGRESTPVSIIQARGKEIQKSIKSIEQWEELTVENVPAYSKNIKKDKMQTSYTDNRYKELKISTKNKVTDVENARQKVLNAISYYKLQLNAACEMKYTQVRYRENLRAIQATRKEIQVEKMGNQAEVEKMKEKSVKGYKEHKEKINSNKRKKKGTDEAKPASVFDDLDLD